MTADILLDFFRNRLEGRHYLQNVAVNFTWLVVDKCIRLGLGLFVSAWVARYLGPDQFGQIGYAVAFIAIFSSLASLGLDGIVVRDLVRSPERKNEILGSAAVMKLIAGTGSVLLSVGLILALHPGNPVKQSLVAITSAGMIFQSVNVIDFWFQSRIQSKYVVIAQSATFALMSLVKVWLILRKASVVAFALVGVVEVSLGYVSLILVYKLCREDMRSWRVRRATMGSLLKDGWPLMIASLSMMVYMRIDQVMLGEMIGDASVGIYSAAVKLAEIWYFIPAAVVSSVFPAIIESKRIGEDVYYGRILMLFSLMTCLSLGISVFLSVFSGPVVRVVFGRDYAPAAPMLMVYIWSSVFSSFGAVQVAWELTENLTRYTLYRTVSGAVLNVILNLFFIPRFQGVGSAMATLLSLGVSVYLINCVSARTRRIFVCQTKSVLFYRHLR